MLLVLSLDPAESVAQQISPDPYAETIEVRVVEVEVEVVDRSGAPVVGLPKSQFELFVDGERREIDYFSETEPQVEPDRPGIEEVSPPGRTSAVRAPASLNLLVFVSPIAGREVSSESEEVNLPLRSEPHGASWDRIDITHLMLDDAAVRTTLEIDDDILIAVKEIAAGRETTAGKVLSELARKALEPVGRGKVRNGVPLLPRRPRGSAKPTMELVNRLRDEA